MKKARELRLKLKEKKAAEDKEKARIEAVKVLLSTKSLLDKVVVYLKQQLVTV